jgi:hypothetical protein
MLSNSSYRRKALALCQQMERYDALEAVQEAVNSLLLKGNSNAA